MGVILLTQIEFQDVSYADKDKLILKGISVKIDAGDYISVVGPSGSGKSTFLKLCCHLISPSEGKILINGNDIMLSSPVDLRKKICYCFQTPILFGNTVEDNLRFPYSIRNEQFDLTRVNMMLSRFNMNKDVLTQETKNLSGGEKQRIALIRSVLFTPEVLLLDEVTSALDAENTAIVENAVDTLNAGGVTILWVTHNLKQSRRRGGKLLTIENGQVKSLEVLK